MYSTHNEGKSIAAERFIRTLRNKIYKHMTAVSKKVYFDKLKKNLRNWKHLIRARLYAKVILKKMIHRIL